MSYSIWVFINKENLPKATAIADVLAGQKIPLSFSTDWDLSAENGFRSMLWQEEVSGCEVELAPLEEDERETVREAGQGDFDSLVVVTARGGWTGLKVAVSFVAALVVAGKGCISEEEGEYIAAGAALAWARKSVADADAAVLEQQLREQAKQSVLAAGDVGAQLDAALATLVGKKLLRMDAVGERLTLAFEAGISVVASSWKVISQTGESYEQARQAVLRAEQMAALTAAMGGSESALDAIVRRFESSIATATKLDAADAKKGLAEVDSWPDDAVIVTAQRPQPHIVALHFSQGQKMTVELIAVDSMMYSVAVRTPQLKFELDPEGVTLA